MRPLAATLVLVLAATGSAQHALLRRAGDLVPVPTSGQDLRGVLQALLAGPTDAQRADGLSSAIPAGTELAALERDGDAVTVVLGGAFPSVVQKGGLEDAIEQIVKTVIDTVPVQKVSLDVVVDGKRQPLDDWLDGLAATSSPTATPLPAPPPPPQAVTVGALSGKTIAVSPGHGYYWHSTLGWTTQRPTIGGLTEDFHTNEIAMRYLIPALENLGAKVISVRERGEILQERLADNDQGAPTYTETGGWTTSGSSGYSGGTYRFANTTSSATATATWHVAVPQDGSYPVYVFYRAGTNRSPDARYTITHSGGQATVIVDQRQDDLRWLHLGDYWFDASQGATITLSNQSNSPGNVVIADAVRVGAGYGSIVRGSSSSGKPRWQECCRYWAQFDGAPSYVYDIAGYDDHDDDVTARPQFAEWRGADAYISLHTNAGGGSGTSSYIHDTAPTPGSASLQRAVHTQIIGDIRQYWSSSWIDRGMLSANFGEVRALSTMPGVLVELAFHDQPGSPDHEALHHPRFRFISGRAYARGVMRYFAPAAPLPPEAPVEFTVTQDGSGGLRLSWSGAVGAAGYSIEQSPDGKGFVEVAQTTQTTWSTGPLPAGTMLSFRVRAFNSSGRSFPTEVLTAGTSHTGRADLLLVQGFDRVGHYVKGPENTRDYLRLHGDAIRRSPFSLGFDATNNEALLTGRIHLSGYRAADWLLGEESTVDETFNGAEQALVTQYLQSGGRLLVSGSEIGWDLDANGSAADRAFYQGVLGARYVADDANTYSFQPGAGALAGVPAGMFDDGTGGTYDVDYPDVIAPADGKSASSMLYATGGVAAIERIDGSGRVVMLGFPLETVLDPTTRGLLMEQALRFLLAPRSLQAPASVALGSTVAVALALPAEAGRPYVLAASAGLGAIPLPGGGLLPLQPDGLFSLSLIPNNGVFGGFQGVLDGGGDATATFTVPNLAVLSGLDVYVCGLTVSPTFAVQTVLPWARIRAQ